MSAVPDHVSIDVWTHLEAIDAIVNTVSFLSQTANRVQVSVIFFETLFFVSSVY